MLRIGHTQLGQERAVDVDEALLLAVVRARRARVVRLVAQQCLPALLAGQQLDLFGRAEQVRVVEPAVEQRAHLAHAVFEAAVLRDVARRVGVQKGQLRFALQRDRPHRHAHEVGIARARLREHEFRERARCERRAEQVGEGVEGCGGGHGLV